MVLLKHKSDFSMHSSKIIQLMSPSLHLNLALKDFTYLFLERGREGKREGEKHQCAVASHMPPTGDLA